MGNGRPGQASLGSGRVFLLSPYTGANLGDQAIVCSLVDCLRQLRNELRIIGITHQPAATASIHGIPCYPLTVAACAGLDGEWLQQPGGRGPAGRPPPRLAVSSRTDRRHPLKEVLRRIPGLRAVAGVVRNLVKLAPRLARESRFSWRAAGLLARGDLLILAGGGQIDDEWGGAWRHPFNVWRWTRLARFKGCRVAVASVGWGSLRSPLSERFFRTALRNADYRSYRDPQSIDLAVALGLPDRGPWIPDHALGLRVASSWLSAPDASRDSVGISPMAFGRTGTWPTEDPECYARYLDAIAQFAVALTREGRTVRLFTTSGMDRHAIDDTLAVMSTMTGARMDLIQVPDTTTLEQLWPVLGACGSVVASRLHGVILAHRLAIPTVAVSFDRKVDAHMQLAGQDAWRMDIRQIDSGALAARHRVLCDGATGVHRQLEEFLAACQPPLASQGRTLVKLLD